MILDIKFQVPSFVCLFGFLRCGCVNAAAKLKCTERIGTGSCIMDNRDLQPFPPLQGDA